MGRSAKVLGSVRTDTTIYRPRVRQSPRRIALRRAVFLAAGLVRARDPRRPRVRGVAERRSPPGTTIAGVDVGGMSEGEAVRVLSARAAALRAARRSPSRPAASRSRSPPPSSASRPTGAPPSRRPPPRAAASARCAASGACGRGSSASTSRRRSSAYDAPSRYKLAQIASSVDRERRRREGRARGARRPGRRGHDRAGSSTATAAAATVVAALCGVRPRRAPSRCRSRPPRRR